MKSITVYAVLNSEMSLVGEFDMNRDGIIQAAKLAVATKKAQTEPAATVKAFFDASPVADMREFISISNDDEYTDDDIADCLRRNGKKFA